MAVACVLGTGCGGSAAGSSEPAATPHEKAASKSADSAPSAGEEPAPEEEAPQAALCDDGTCHSCGSGMCLTGWYCDESAKGGAACGWLPQCAEKPSCACLSKVLGPGCACSEQGGGPHVTCK
jgi:hypothetical protein